MSLLGAGKTRLTLTPYTTATNGTISLTTSDSFTVMLNPSEFTHTLGISYDKTRTLGDIKPEKKFSGMNAEKLSFAITLDGTGVVPTATPGMAKYVMALIRDLNKVVYEYNGSTHQPSQVRLLWGTLIFFGRLESMSVKYTLFKPSGDPLRARVEMGMVGDMSKKEAELVGNRSSPDLSHMVEVRQGDTLPLLCQRIYGDPSYYLEVARFNRLVDFRNLQPGGRLHFPPLE